MRTMFTILGVALWACGIAGIFFVKRRSFYRRNAAGLETFDGYGKMLVTRAFESAVNIGSLFCFCAGVIVFIIAGNQ